MKKQIPASQRKVLVLNRSWVPIGIFMIDKAIKKLASEYKDGTPKARIIDCVNDFCLVDWDDWITLPPAENEPCMRSVNTTFRIPEVIQFTRYDKTPRMAVRYNRKAIGNRDESTCQYCGEKKARNELSLDHVIPRCQGGPTTWENIVIACTDCNARKAGRTPREAGMRLLREPKKPKYNFYTGDLQVKAWSNFIVEKD